MIKEPENIEAIIEWCRVCRPDLVPQIETIIKQDMAGPFLLLTIAFEAGRCFQDVNPGCPLGAIPPDEWKPITDAARKSCQ